MPRHDDRVRMLHMLDYAREALEAAQGRTVADLRNDRLRSLALTHLLELVGEAANRVSTETRVRYPTIPWRNAIDLRNRLIHGYDTLDPQIILGVAQREYPPLVAELERILNEVSKTGGTIESQPPEKG